MAELAIRLREKYPDRVPIVVKLDRNAALKCYCTKFLVPGEYSMGKFLIELRRFTDIKPEQAIFLFCGKKGVLIPTCNILEKVYQDYKNKDGFLYFTITLENTFGAEDACDFILEKCARIARVLNFISY